MSWKTINGRRYLYESERRGERVISRYVAAGEFAELVAGFDAFEAAERAEARARAKGEAAEFAEVGRKVRGACDLLRRLAEAMLREAGYHRATRGRWRRARRMNTTLNISRNPSHPGTMSAAEVQTLADGLRAADPKALKRLKKVGDGVLAGDADSLADFLNLYRADRAALRHLLATILDVPRELLVRKAMSGDGERVGVAWGILRDEVEQVAARLAGANPSEVERLLAERAATCWLACYVEDNRAILAIGTVRSGSDLRHHNSAHVRYLSALKALASVRRLPPMALVQVHMRQPALDQAEGDA